MTQTLPKINTVLYFTSEQILVGQPLK